MSESKRQQVRRLFMEVSELGESERAVVLARECAGDDALRAEVERLLRAEHDAGAFFSRPTAGEAPKPAGNAALATNEKAGALIGRYKLLEQIGEGGMGTIWMAEQREPVKRRVALKIIKLGMDTKQVIARFEAERQALAMMDHPHIAKVLDAGATETGRPYFVMEYIKGIPILEYCDKERLDTKARLALFTSVCHAIQHAHQKGIIHRDIKPSNVLVTLHDGVPVTKVIDFGIAKATNSELTTKTLFTEHRQMIGTPAYMSPEQAEMSGLDIDTRSDVYSLGVLLYELLTGTTPFDTKALLESGYAEMMRAIREDEPHKPSTRISSLGDTGTRTAQQRRADINKLSVLLRGDLDWIVMKCLEKDRTRRYDTANGVAADIVRHLRDEPISAGAPSASYKLHKFIKRNRAQVIAASAVLTALLVAIVGSSWGLVEKSRASSAQTLRQLEDDQRSATESARRTRNAEAVGALLDQCEAALHSGDASKARIAMDAAYKRASEGGAESQADWLARTTADLDLSTELDAIDQFRWTWNRTTFGNPDIAATRTRDALQRFGVDLEAVSVDTTAARIGASAIRERIVLALDLLLWWDKPQPARTVLRQVDPDPYRDAFRDAVIARDWETVATLARDPAALEQPTEFAITMGQCGAIPTEQRRDLLERATFRQPSDIGLLMTLQGLSRADDKDMQTDYVRWLQAAVSADPRNSAAYTNLGLALKRAGHFDEALACYRTAIATGQQNVYALNDMGGLLSEKGAYDEALAAYRKAIELDPKNGFFVTNMGAVFAEQGNDDAAIAYYRKGIELDPKDGYAYARLGDAQKRKGQVDEAIASYRKAVELGTDNAAPYSFLGDELRDKNRFEEAIVCYRKCTEIEPKAAWMQGRLGDALRQSGKVDEAIACYRKAIEVDPKYDAYGPLGEALMSKGRADEAIAEYKKSLELDPRDARVLVHLSKALGAQGRAEEAMDCARKAVEIAPTLAEAHDELGIQLYQQGHVDEARACFRKAIEIDPGDANAYHSLGVTLFNAGNAAEALPHYERAAELAPERVEYRSHLAEVQQRMGEHHAALESFRRVVELDPKNTWACNNVGNELGWQRRWEESIEWYRKALEIDPNMAEALCGLSGALANVGRFGESLECIRRGDELGSARSDWRYPSEEWVRDAEKRVALEAKLPALLAGEVKPADDAERLEIAKVCQAKDQKVAAVKLYAEAFVGDARLAEDSSTRSRYEAACCAAVAASGHEGDAAQLDDVGRARLRRQALEWLRADLALHAKRLETGKAEDRTAVRETLSEWRGDADLGGVRDAEGLALMSAEERGEFERLWAEVAKMVERTAVSKAEARER